MNSKSVKLREPVPTREIIADYSGDLDECYREMSHILERMEASRPNHRGDKFDEWHKRKMSTVRRCAALSAAASKRAKRSFVLCYLDLLAGDHDFTITNVSHCVREVLGRNVDSVVIAKDFGTKGRTAADKSSWSHEQLDQLVEQMKSDLDVLLKHMARVRAQIQASYASQRG